MNVAEKIISLFDGQTRLAELLQKKQSTIQYWAKIGHIPKKYHQELLTVAKEKGIDLTPAELDSTSQFYAGIDEIKIPRATHWGELEIGGEVLPCYVLETGDRVFSLKGVVVGLIGTDGGQLPEYLKVRALQAFLPVDLTPDEDGKLPALIQFDTGAEGFTKYAQGLPVERFMDLCAAYVDAMAASIENPQEHKLTPRQKDIVVRAMSFQKATAKTGIIALVDEVTGYQYDRAKDALQLKLKVFLEEEMRKWEKTFPDELWKEFGRLTKWNGPVHLRPKYWGKLVNELIYGYLDPDVYKWLKENAPRPRHGMNYHQWLSAQYGLKKLTELIWMFIGMSSTCNNIEQARRKMAEKFGRIPLQLTFYVPGDIKLQ